MEFLKEILGDSYETVENAINTYNAKPENKDKQIKLANIGTGEYVGKGKYDALEIDKNNLETQITTLNNTITTLKKDNRDNENLQNTITNLNNDIQKLKDNATATTKTFVLKEQLSKAGVLDPDYLIYKQGGLDKFNFDKEGKPIGIEDIVKPLKEDKSMVHLFQVIKPGYTPSSGQGGSGVNPFAKETFNLTEQGKLLRENPAQAKELASAAGVQI